MHFREIHVIHVLIRNWGDVCVCVCVRVWMYARVCVCRGGGGGGGMWLIHIYFWICVTYGALSIIGMVAIGMVGYFENKGIIWCKATNTNTNYQASLRWSLWLRRHGSVRSGIVINNVIMQSRLTWLYHTWINIMFTTVNRTFADVSNKSSIIGVVIIVIIVIIIVNTIMCNSSFISSIISISVIII